MLERIKKILREHRGFVSLAIRTAVFVLILSAVLFWLTEYFRTFFPRSYILETNVLRDTIGDFLTEFAKYSVIAGFMFFAVFRDKFFDILSPKNRKLPTIIFSASAVVSFAIFYLVKYLNASKNIYVLEHLNMFVLLKYLFMFLGIFSLAFALYTPRFLTQFIKEHWKHILITYVISFLVYNFVMYIRHFWHFFSKIVTYAVYFVLSLTFDNVTYNFANPNFPSLRVEDFAVVIGSPCSGIDGMTLFVTLYVIIVSFDWKNVDKLKAFIFLPFGTLGMFCMNTLRVYLLLIVGVLYSKEFAIGAFHSNIGWILFLCYFLTFLYVMYPHLLSKKVRKKL